MRYIFLYRLEIILPLFLLRNCIFLPHRDYAAENPETSGGGVIPLNIGDIRINGATSNGAYLHIEKPPDL